MQDSIVLERFRKFKSMILSSNISGSLLLEMVENYITAEGEPPVDEPIPVMDGQMSLLDYAA